MIVMEADIPTQDISVAECTWEYHINLSVRYDPTSPAQTIKVAHHAPSNPVMACVLDLPTILGPQVAWGKNLAVKYHGSWVSIC